MGATLLCASCLASSTPAYGGILVDHDAASGQPTDGGQEPADGAADEAERGDAAPDAKK